MYHAQEFYFLQNTARSPFFRTGFAEPLHLAKPHFDSDDAIANAAAADAAFRQIQDAKERRVADFRARLKKRLQGERERDQEVKQNETLQLQKADDILMRSVDAMKKLPVVVCSKSQVRDPSEYRSRFELFILQSIRFLTHH